MKMYKNGDLIYFLLVYIIYQSFSISHSTAKQINSDVNVESALKTLTESVIKLSNRVDALEGNLQKRFSWLENNFIKENSSLDRLVNRLEILDNLSEKVTKFEHEVSRMRGAITSTNNEVNNLATRLEEIEQKHYSEPESSDVSNINLRSTTKKDLDKDSLFREISQENIDKIFLTLADNISQKIERMLPRAMAGELNHFYINMIVKLDQTLGQLQKDSLVRLRRIERHSQEALKEVQDGRQDISHLMHLTRTQWENVTHFTDLILKGTTIISSCNNSDVKNMDMLLQNVIKNVTMEMNELKTNILHSLSLPKTEIKLGQPSTTHLWEGIFSGKNKNLNHGDSRSETLSSKVNTGITARRCPDPLTFAALEEVKELLSTLVIKGEDLRKALTKQTEEGVDLLKLLHQRFSVLARRMNTDPNHGEALVAEVQELEHLVENSYASILYAQNAFITSCHKIQEAEPSIEQKIAETLNELLTNVELGQQFNKKQIQEMKLLVEDISDQSKWFSFLPTVKNPSNSGSSEFHEFEDDDFTRQIHEFFTDINSAEDEFHKAIERISLAEQTLQNLEWESTEAKNTVDTLLTAVKDIKGYSRSQINSFDHLQDGLTDLLEEYIEFKNILMSKDYSDNLLSLASAFASVSNTSDLSEENTLFLTEKCAVSLLSQLNLLKKSSSNKSNKDNGKYNKKSQIAIKQNNLRKKGGKVSRLPRHPIKAQKRGAKDNSLPESISSTLEPYKISKSKSSLTKR